MYDYSIHSAKAVSHQRGENSLPRRATLMRHDSHSLKYERRQRGTYVEQDVKRADQVKILIEVKTSGEGFSLVFLLFNIFFVYILL